ncbi:hypothetical protein [Pseudomonas huanghezhanensis]|uniref:hypothetical protein n=1 Tax=Pseudomonas huanghezhanensis TaxID=3002903 RepID=UPI002286CDF1|nr:hypothetical protein [Pseudomonas sp. BSw22131]
MERLIEFPLASEYITSTQLTSPVLAQGYCVCYQHDVNEYGYGPYGFRSEAAKNLISNVFEQMEFWCEHRGKMFNSRIPNGAGVYFYQDQLYVTKLENDLAKHQRKVALHALRDRYGRSSPNESACEKPLLLSVYENGKIRVDAISVLIKEDCAFFLIYHDLNLGGDVFIFFDPSIRDKIKNYSKHNHINYAVVDSIDMLNDW